MFYFKYGGDGLKILGFPSHQHDKADDLSIEEFKEYFEKLEIKFDVFYPVNLMGKDKHPLYAFLESRNLHTFYKPVPIHWMRFLIDRNGIPVGRYFPKTPIRSDDYFEALVKDLL